MAHNRENQNCAFRGAAAGLQRSWRNLCRAGGPYGKCHELQLTQGQLWKSCSSSPWVHCLLSPEKHTCTVFPQLSLGMQQAPLVLRMCSATASQYQHLPSLQCTPAVHGKTCSSGSLTDWRGTGLLPACHLCSMLSGAKGSSFLLLSRHCQYHQHTQKKKTIKSCFPFWVSWGKTRVWHVSHFRNYKYPHKDHFTTSQ